MFGFTLRGVSAQAIASALSGVLLSPTVAQLGPHHQFAAGEGGILGVDLGERILLGFRHLERHQGRHHGGIRLLLGHVSGGLGRFPPEL